MLPFAANLRRLILSFHKSVQVSRPASVCPNDAVPGTTPLSEGENSRATERVKRGRSAGRKLQVPNSKLQRGSKFQIPNGSAGAVGMSADRGPNFFVRAWGGVSLKG